MTLRPFFFIPALAFLLAACGQQDKETPVSGPENIYPDYTVTGDEQIVMCKAQYRSGGQEGDAIGMQPGSVTLDGRALTRDSTKFDGVYYEISQLPGSFGGPHSIGFTGSDGKRREAGFDFYPFRLAPAMPERLSRQGFTFHLVDFPEGPTPLRVVLADTAFDSKWVNEVVTVQGGNLTLTPQMLAGLAAGPVGLELYLEQEQRLSLTAAGGRLSITYVLKREFVLVE